MKIILCDIHGTLLDGNRVINPVKLILESLSKDKGIEVCLITAEPLNSSAYGKLQKLLNNRRIHYPIYYLEGEEAKELKDSEIKQRILKGFQDTHKSSSVILAIDNKKSICKMYRKEGISTMKFKE